MKEAAQAAVLAALPGDPAKGEMTYMPCDTCHFMQAEGSAYSMRRV
jgi:cytochrome c2